MRNSKLFIAGHRNRLVATLRLATRKPWAIDASYFTPCPRPLYLLSMAVATDLQRQGLGRQCLVEAARLAQRWPAQTLRLDAFDGAAGAGEFYRKCGFSERGRVVYRGAPLIYFELLL
jgi:GNAT superfamily N-acetyltransferase